MATIHTPQQYAEIYQILQKHDNSRQIVDYIKQAILPEITPNAYLDIGAGEGKITRNLLQFFDQTTAVEPNPEYTNYLQKLPGLKVIDTLFQQVEMRDNFDFILCSHVMYHVAQDEWECFILKAYHQLKTGGKLMFVLPSDKGTHYRKCVQYNPNYLCYRLLTSIADRHRIPYNVHIDNARYTTKSLDEMYRICRFSILEDSFTLMRYQQLFNNGIGQFDKDVMDYAKTKQTNDGNYLLVLHPAFVVLDKP